MLEEFGHNTHSSINVCNSKNSDVLSIDEWVDGWNVVEYETPVSVKMN